MASKYVDKSALIQVIGTVFNNPNLLDAEDKYSFDEEDFYDDFHKIVFEPIYNLYKMGAQTITIEAIEDYLNQRPKKMGIYKAYQGREYLLKCSDVASLATFNYYYNRLKKMTLFRGYERLAHMDLSWLYDPDNIFDTKKKAEQEDWFDNTPIEKIADTIDEKIDEIRSTYVDETPNDECQVGFGIDELLEDLKENPEIGYPLFGHYVNTITKGARLKKFYLRSAATGIGKTRSMVADACYIGCSQMYDLKSGQWVTTGKPQKVLYIATEQPIDEIQTMMLAFVSGVDEEHILNADYFAGEWERVAKASLLLKQSQIYFKALPDFSLKDIENTIKRNIREHDIQYCFLDYLHTSMKILEEVTKRSGGVRLREDNILFMISITLKDICNQYGIFILSATQLNGDYRDAKEYDQNLLRGAKSIADKIDVGMIMLKASQEDLEALKPILEKGGFEPPDTKISVYKNRRGRWKDVLMWCKSNKGICRIDPMFVTKYDYELCEIEDLKIKVEEDSIF